jgi:hypothetical protein
MEKVCGVCAKRFQGRGKERHCSLQCRVIGNTQFADNGCLNWIAAARRYGVITVGGKAEGAHRAAWTAFNGDIPAGMFVCHRCDNPLCCNPNHLFLGRHEDNMADMMSKNRHGMLGRKHKAESIEKLRKNAFTGANTPEKRKQQSEMMKARWKDDPQWKYRSA